MYKKSLLKYSGIVILFYFLLFVICKLSTIFNLNLDMKVYVAFIILVPVLNLISGIYIYITYKSKSKFIMLLILNIVCCFFSLMSIIKILKIDMTSEQYIIYFFVMTLFMILGYNIVNIKNSIFFIFITTKKIPIYQIITAIGYLIVLIYIIKNYPSKIETDSSLKSELSIIFYMAGMFIVSYLFSLGFSFVSSIIIGILKNEKRELIISVITNCIFYLIFIFAVTIYFKADCYLYVFGFGGIIFIVLMMMLGFTISTQVNKFIDKHLEDA